MTVVAPDATDAEGHATALAISSLDDAKAHLALHPQLGALFIDTSGDTHAIGVFPLEARSQPIGAVR